MKGPGGGGQHDDLNLREINRKLDGISSGQERLEKALVLVRRQLGSLGAANVPDVSMSMGLRNFSPLPSVVSPQDAGSPQNNNAPTSPTGNKMANRFSIPENSIQILDAHTAADMSAETRKASATSTAVTATDAGGNVVGPNFFADDDYSIFENQLELRDELKHMGQTLRINTMSMTKRKSNDSLENVRLSSSFMQSRRASSQCGRVLSPDGSIRMTLDVLSMLLLVADSVLVPYVLAWDVPVTGFWLGHAFFNVIFWTLDMVLSFFTGYYDKDHVLVSNLHKLAKRYLQTHFAFDAIVVGCDWMDLVLELVGNHQLRDLATVKVLRLLKLGRLVRLGANIRAAKIVNFYTQIYRVAQKHGLSDLLTFSVNITKIIFLIVWINHLGGCMWYFFGQDGAAAWHGFLDLGGDLQYESTDYLLYLYWSVTAMVSGASFMSPTSDKEILYITLWVLFSLMFGSTLISSLAAMLMELELSNREWSKEIQLLRAFLYQNQIPVALGVRVEHEIRDIMAREKRLSEADVSTLTLLSSKVRAELWVSVYGERLSRPVFMRAAMAMDPTYLRSFCQHAFNREFLSAGTEIFKPDLEAQGCYCIHSGSLLYQQRDTELGDSSKNSREMMLPARLDHENPDQHGSPRALRSDVSTKQVRIDSESGRQAYKEYREDPSGTFPVSNASSNMKGQVITGDFICEMALWTQWFHCGWMETATPCELITVLVESFIKILYGHPEVATVLFAYSTSFCRLAKEAAEKDPTFLQSDFNCRIQEESILPLLPLESRIRMSTPAFVYLAGELRWSEMLGGTRLLQDVATQVNEGHCDLTLDTERGPRPTVVKVVSMVTLKLCTHPAGKVLVELGTYHRHRWTEATALPSLVLGIGETVEEAQERLFNRVLDSQTRHKIEVQSIEDSYEEKVAKTVPAVTRIKRTLITAIIDEKDLPPMTRLLDAEDKGTIKNYHQAHLHAHMESELSMRSAIIAVPDQGVSSSFSRVVFGRKHAMASQGTLDLALVLKKIQPTLDGWEFFCIPCEDEHEHRTYIALAFVNATEYTRVVHAPEGHEVIKLWLQDHLPPQSAHDLKYPPSSSGEDDDEDEDEVAGSNVGYGRLSDTEPDTARTSKSTDSELSGHYSAAIEC